MVQLPGDKDGPFFFLHGTGAREAMAAASFPLGIDPGLSQGGRKGLLRPQPISQAGNSAQQVFLPFFPFSQRPYKNFRVSPYDPIFLKVLVPGEVD